MGLMESVSAADTRESSRHGTVTRTVDTIRDYFESGATKPLAWREAQLDGLLRFLDEREQDLCDALAADLGRPAVEAYVADIGTTAAEIAHLRKHVGRWIKPRRAKLPLTAMPGKGRVMPEPLGVALIIAPWNYPVQLLLEPIAAAFAAGNAVVAKPSELAPATSLVVAQQLPAYLDQKAFAVFEGAVDVSTALLAERFDHIFFTGSTRVGRVVMEAAAKHLTPVTLELGGKSPCIVDDTVDLDTAAHRIMFGKWLNAGQTCVAPDYVLVGAARRDELVDKIQTVIEEFAAGPVADTPDFGRIVNDGHFARLVDFLDGQTVAVGGEHDSATRFFAPTVVVDPPLDSPLMTEEIFGPILPVVAVESMDAAIDFVKARPKPLALYVFSDQDDTVDAVLSGTSSGGVCVNHTLLHITPPDLPLGGVGPAGMGRYHGESGFEAFSNMKTVLRKPLLGENSFLYPPYKGWKQRLIRKLL